MTKKVEFKNPLSCFDAGSLESIARIIGDTSNGLTGPEIQRHLANCRITDVDQQNTKWKRLYNALAAFQNEHRVGNHVILLVNSVMNPALNIRNEGRNDFFKSELNQVLSFSGYQINDEGKVQRASVATTINQAKKRAQNLKTKLESRKAHAEVLKFCNEQLLQNNYFHAVFEALKSITARIRNISSLDGDGADLIDKSFSSIKSEDPKIKINSYDTETKKGEQRGFVNLLKGLYGTFRNPIGHESKIEWEMTEDDALDILSMISLVHRKLDKAVQ